MRSRLRQAWGPRQRDFGLTYELAHHFGHAEYFGDTSGGLSRREQRRVWPASLPSVLFAREIFAEQWPWLPQDQ